MLCYSRLFRFNFKALIINFKRYSMNILVIGSGGREHALAWKLKQSKQCEKLFVAPGNAGTDDIAVNVAIGVDEFEKLADCIIENDIRLIVVGPEAPLVGGLVDYLRNLDEIRDLAIVGPSKRGAMLEGSKDFAKKFMAENGIPTAASASFTEETIEDAVRYLSTLKPPYVLKADGLAAGKGVAIVDNQNEAVETLKEMLLEKKFGAASSKVVIEEYLHGIELSVFVLTDGVHYKILPEAKDYKRIGENDTGPNTGGMGSVSPVPFADAAFLKKVEERIIKPTVEGLAREKIDYKGFIFIGLMNVNGDPYVIEYNVRMGDPETEVVIPRIKNDFVELLYAAATGTLDKADLDVDPRTAATVVMAAGGYPGSYEKGKIITGLDQVKQSVIFHAGTRKNSGGEILTNGGRVLAVTSLGGSLNEALSLSYEAADMIKWQNVYYRKDIGKDLLPFLR